MFMHRIFTLIGLTLCMASAAAQESERAGSLAELALSDDTIQLRYTTESDPLGVDGGRLGGAFFLSEERDIVLSAGLLFPSTLDLGRLSVVFGPQLYAALLEEENNDVMSISVGTEIRLVLHPRTGLAVAGHAYYAPDILTFGAADNLTDLGARLELGIAPRLIAFGGMRWFEFDLVDGAGERTLQEELLVGFGYRF